MTVLLRWAILLAALAALIVLGRYALATFVRYNGPAENTLGETGFDIDAARRGELANTYRFAPTYPFWSDGAQKERYIFLPEARAIDNADPDRWNFPEGVRLWKVFTRNGAPVETRMLLKTGDAPDAWDMAVYNGVDPRARKLAFGKSNAAGTPHDIPSPSQCLSCHGAGEERRPLGFTAIQLPWTDSANLSMRKLADMDRLSVNAVRPLIIPGDALAQNALGYLDTNCGSCHYEGSTFVPENISLRLNLTAQTLGRVEDTNAYRTAVNVRPHRPGLGAEFQVRPGAPAESFLYRRMSIRDNGGWQMPPLASERVDEQGVSAIGQWIDSLSGDDGGAPAQAH